MLYLRSNEVKSVSLFCILIKHLKNILIKTSLYMTKKPVMYRDDESTEEPEEFSR